MNTTSLPRIKRLSSLVLLSIALGSLGACSIYTSYTPPSTKPPADIPALSSGKPASSLDGVAMMTALEHNQLSTYLVDTINLTQLIRYAPDHTMFRMNYAYLVGPHSKDRYLLENAALYWSTPKGRISLAFNRSSSRFSSYGGSARSASTTLGTTLQYQMPLQASNLAINYQLGFQYHENDLIHFMQYQQEASWLRDNYDQKDFSAAITLSKAFIGQSQALFTYLGYNALISPQSSFTNGLANGYQLTTLEQFTTRQQATAGLSYRLSPSFVPALSFLAQYDVAYRLNKPSGFEVQTFMRSNAAKRHSERVPTSNNRWVQHFSLGTRFTAGQWLLSVDMEALRTDKWVYGFGFGFHGQFY